MTGLLLALAAGAVVGLALGALGGGGSVLAVPALLYLFAFTPASATTASLLIVIATSLAGLAAHARDGHVRWRTGGLFAAAGIVPAAAAGALSAHLPPAALTVAFAAVAALAAARMLRTRRAPDGRDGGGREQVRPLAAAAAGAALGAVTGFLGVGGGFLAVPALVAVLALPMTEAVGTSLLVITVNSAAALVTRLGTAGSLHWAVVGPFAGAAILGAWDGKRLASRVSGPVLQRIFAGVLLAVAAFMVVDAVR